MCFEKGGWFPFVQWAGALSTLAVCVVVILHSALDSKKGGGGAIAASGAVHSRIPVMGVGENGNVDTDGFGLHFGGFGTGGRFHHMNDDANASVTLVRSQPPAPSPSGGSFFRIRPQLTRARTAHSAQLCFHTRNTTHAAAV